MTEHEEFSSSFLLLPGCLSSPIFFFPSTLILYVPLSFTHPFPFYILSIFRREAKRLLQEKRKKKGAIMLPKIRRRVVSGVVRETQGCWRLLEARWRTRPRYGRNEVCENHKAFKIVISSIEHKIWNTCAFSLASKMALGKTRREYLRNGLTDLNFVQGVGGAQRNLTAIPGLFLIWRSPAW